MKQVNKTDFYIHNAGSIILESCEYIDEIPPGEYRLIELYQNRSYAYGLRPVVYDKPAGDSVDTEHTETFHSYFPLEKWSGGLKKTDQVIHHFLNESEFYRKNGLDYRRSVLLYGDPGTGKSQYIHHVTQRLIKEESAIVVRLYSSRDIDSLMDGVGDKLGGLSNRLKVFVIEEIAGLTDAGYTNELMTFLDNQRFRENVLVLMSSNYPEQIPENLIDRPGRIDTLCRVSVKDYGEDFIKSWYNFVTGKSLSPDELNSEWLREVKNRLSPAYLKELFIAAEIHEMNIGQMWEIIKSRRDLINNLFSRKRTDEWFGFDITEEDLEDLKRVLEEN